MLDVVQRHPDHQQTQCGAIYLLGQLFESDSQCKFRGAFASVNGWTWLLNMVDRHSDSHLLQHQACRMIDQLCRGGAFSQGYEARAVNAVQAALARHGEDEDILYWGLWAMQRLNGAHALVTILRSGDRRVTSTCLTALGSMTWGQADGTGMEACCLAIEGIVLTLQVNTESNILCQGTNALGSAAAYAASAGPDVPDQALFSFLFFFFRFFLLFLPSSHPSSLLLFCFFLFQCFPFFQIRLCIKVWSNFFVRQLLATLGPQSYFNDSILNMT